MRMEDTEKEPRREFEKGGLLSDVQCHKEVKYLKKHEMSTALTIRRSWGS